jgi:hypothetical protein
MMVEISHSCGEKAIGIIDFSGYISYMKVIADKERSMGRSMKNNNIWTAALILGLAVSTGVHGQKLNSDVKLILERLPLEKQKKLENFAADIQTYINDFDWTETDSDYEIPLSIQIYLQDMSSSYEDRYGGTFLISNTSDVQYYDKYWRFPHQAEDRLIHDDTVYKPFNGFINFYVYLVLGAEFDKWGDLAGTPFFEKAKQVNDQARFDTQFILGWEERTKLLQRIISLDNIPFRKSKSQFYSALTAAEGDTSVERSCGHGLALIETVLKKDPEHKDALDFLKAHYLQIAEIFKNDDGSLRRLIAVDPDHKDAYQRFIDE